MPPEQGLGEDGATVDVALYKENAHLLWPQNPTHADTTHHQLAWIGAMVDVLLSIFGQRISHSLGAKRGKRLSACPCLTCSS